MKLNYIPDKEKILLEEDLLGTLPYVETLIEVIKICNTPFTVGLLGGWGSGKSSIITTLQRKLHEKTKGKIKVFIYDAWKYSKDSFRRTFIFELKKFFKLKSSEELESFYKDKHEEIGGKVGLTKLWWVYILLFIVPILLINLKPFFIDKSFELTTFIISLCFSALTTLITKTFIQYKISITKPRVFAPEQFEEIFKEIIYHVTARRKNIWKWIEGIFKKNGIEKVVIAIDNIDRCHKELAIELLLTIKNFLEIENVVFILPVDEEGLKEYLRISDQNADAQDANEFLRKLFNTTVKIRKFSENELFDFSSKLDAKYKINVPDTVLSVISREFSKNPRRIIQFLNTFQTEIILAEYQEEVDLIPKGAITGNLNMLAKLVIIREEWPDLYDRLFDDLSLLEKINRALRNKQFKYVDNRWCLKIDHSSIGLTEEQYRFLVSTQSFEYDNLEPFFINKDVFPDIPDEINSLVLSQDWEALKRNISDGVIVFDRLLSLIEKRLDIDVIKRNLFRTSGFNVLSLIFKIAADRDFSSNLKKSYPSSTFQKIKSVLSMGEVMELIFKFNPDELVNFARWLWNNGFGHLSEKIATAINRADSINESNIQTIKAFIIKYKDVPILLKKIRSKVSEIIASDTRFYDDFKDILRDASIAQYLVHENLISSQIDALQPNFNQENITEHIAVIQSVKRTRGLSSKLNKKYIEKILPFLNTPNWEIMNFWFKSLFGSIEIVEDENLHTSIFNMLQGRYSFLISQYASGQIAEINLECYLGFLKNTKELHTVSKKHGNQCAQWLSNFFNRNESHDIYLQTNEIFYELIDYSDAYDWPFSKHIINRFKKTDDWEEKKKFASTLNCMFRKTKEEKGLSAEEIKDILKEYVSLLGQDGEHIDRQEIKKWLKESADKNEFVKGILREQLGNSLAEESTAGKVWIYKIMTEIGYTDALDVVLKSIRKCGQLRIFIGKIKADLKHAKIVEVIMKALRKERDKRRNKCYMEIVVGFRDVLQESELEILYDKIRPLLASNNIKDQKIAIDLVYSLNTIPESKIHLIRTLLDTFKISNFDKEYKQKINKIKRKLGKSQE